MTVFRSARKMAVLCGLLFASVASSAAAQGTWQSLAPLPEPIEGPSVGNVANLIILAYGHNENGDSNKTFIYNIPHDSWTEGPAAPGGPNAEGIGIGVGNSFYALGGRDLATGSNNNRYTPATNTWTSLAPLPEARGGLGAASVGQSIYAIGGREGGAPCLTAPPTAEVERYDIAANTWTPVAPLPTPRSDVGAVAQGGKIYVFGGCSGAPGTQTDEVEIYNPTTNAWSEGAPMPTPRAAFYGIGVKGNSIYVMGGLSPVFPGHTAANEVYDIAHNSWSEAAPMTHPRGEMGVASHGGGIFTVGGGDPAFGTEQTTNDLFTP